MSYIFRGRPLYVYSHIGRTKSLRVVHLDTQALKFLISLITPGNTISRTPALLPPPQHIALACTLAVHPTLTTRAKSEDRLEAANLALRYLRLVLKLVGPVNGNLQDAFVFTGIGTSSRRGTVGRRRTTDELHTSSDDEHNINSDLAGPGAIWSQAEDFWQVVGWAFNCSVHHKRRWEYWSLWLEYMIEVLEKDWETRVVEFETYPNDDSDPRATSMIVQYLSAGESTTWRDRKILRAIFADGSARSMAEFPEIWKNETRERKKASEDRSRQIAKIDFKEGNYGDYNVSESSELEESTPSSPIAPISPPPDEVPDVAAALGGTQSIGLRLQLLSLLSNVSAMVPETFLPLPALYDLCHEQIRPLPLPTFFIFMSPASLSLVTAAAASTLTQYILRSFIASGAPLPPTDSIAQDILESHFLPFAANTQSVADNARVSLCIETLLHLLAKHVGLEWSEGLVEASEKGIEAREQKAKREGKKRMDSGQTGGERIWLTASAQRIRFMVDMCKMSRPATGVMHRK